MPVLGMPSSVSAYVKKLMGVLPENAVPGFQRKLT